MLLIDAADKVSARLQAHARYYPDIPAALIQIIINEFNDSYRKAFMSALLVRCPLLTNLAQMFTKIHFRLERMAITRALRDEMRPQYNILWEA